jgi:4-hydroxy-tetrahydrodipicolinate synthase
MMREPLFTGSGVALVTPFRDGRVHEETLRELVRFHLREGTDALVVNGSTGEAAAMTIDEQRRVAEVAVDEAGGRLPVIVGTGGSSTAAVRGLASAARDAGADAILVSMPPYNKPSQEGMEAHALAVMEAGGLPAILYNVPGRTACNLLPPTVERLAEHPLVVGIKEACGDISQIADLARRVGGRIAVYSGNDDQIVPFLALGGVGVITVLGNVAPADTSRLVHTFLAGDVAGARELQLRYLPLTAALFREPNPVPVKAALSILGFDVREVRLPLLPAAEETWEVLRARMEEAGLTATAGA